MRNSERNKIVWTPSDRVLPMRSIQRGSRIGGAFLILFALAWCGVLYCSIVMGTLKEGADIPMALFLLFFSLPGLLFLYLGLNVVFGSTRVTLDSDSVEVLRKRIVHSTLWREPIHSFTGVLRRVIHYQSSDGPDYSEYLVLLVHTDPNKELRLFDSRSSVGWETAWREFAKELQLPLLDESEEGIYRFDSGSFCPQTTATPPPVAVHAKGIEVRLGADGYRFRLRNAPTAWRGVLGVLVAGGIAAAAWLLQPYYPGDKLLQVFAWVMAAFVLIAFGSLLRALHGHTELLVGRDRVEYRPRSGRIVTLPTAGVHTVTVKSDPIVGNAPAMVTIEGDGKTIQLAAWRSHQVKSELANAIAAALGEMTGKGAQTFQPKILLPGQRVAQRRAAKMIIGAIAAFFAVLVPLMWLAFHDRPAPTPGETAVDEAHEQWRVLAESGYADYRAGRDTEAVAKLERAVELAERLGRNSRSLSVSLYRLSQAVERQGDLRRAAALAERSLKIIGARGETGEWVAHQYWRLSGLLERLGDAEAAADRRREALRLFRQAGVEPPPSNDRKEGIDPRIQAMEEQRRRAEESRARATGADQKQAPELSQQPRQAIESIRLSVQRLHPQQGRAPTRYNPVPIDLMAQPSGQLGGLPGIESELLFGELSLGTEALRFRFVLTSASPAHLWLDRNRNGDLSDDGPPLQGSNDGVFGTEVKLLVPPLNTPLSLWLYSHGRLLEQRQLTFYNRTQLVGRPLIGGREYLIVLAERGMHDGRYDNDGIYVDINRNGSIEPSEYIAPGADVVLLGRSYRFEIVQ